MINTILLSIAVALLSFLVACIVLGYVRELKKRYFQMGIEEGAERVTKIIIEQAKKEDGFDLQCNEEKITIKIVKEKNV